MLSERWQPKKGSELVGLATTVQAVTKWLSGWKRGSALLMHGPPGCGKSALIRALAADLDRDVIRVEDVENIHSIVSVTSQTTLSGKKRIVIVDDIDAMAAENRAIVGEILSAIVRSRWPVILTAIDPWEPAIRSLRQKCTMLAMRPLASPSIANRLKDVNEGERMNIGPQLLQAAAATAAGDMRAGFNYLELLSAGADGAELSALDKVRSPFELLSVLFKGRSMAAARQAIDEADIDLDAIFAWIDTNILVEWQRPEQAAEAFELLSKADMMRRRHVDTARANLALFALLRGGSGWTRYNPPDRSARYKNIESEMAAARLAPILHCSKQKVRGEHAPYFFFINAKSYP